MSVYVGIGVHRKRPQVAVITEDGTVELNKNVVNGSEPMLRLIGDLPPGTLVVSWNGRACSPSGSGPATAVGWYGPLRLTAVYPAVDKFA
jgi:hypothetical protein